MRLIGNIVLVFEDASAECWLEEPASTDHAAAVVAAEASSWYSAVAFVSVSRPVVSLVIAVIRIVPAAAFSPVLYVSASPYRRVGENRRPEVQVVHPQNVSLQNVRFQNVRFQNIWNVRFTKRQLYKTSGLQNIRFTKRQVFKTSRLLKKHPFIFCTCDWWKSAGSVAANVLKRDVLKPDVL